MSSSNLTNGSNMMLEPSLFYISIPRPFIVPLMGYFYPFLAVLTILTNTVVVIVFTKKMRSSTSVILVALALSENLGCLCMLPDYIYLFTLKNYKTYVPYGWCLYHQYMPGCVYRVAHTSSNWITVILGFQRYIVVRFPFKAKRLCSVRNALLASSAAFVVAVLVHLNLFLIMEVLPVTPESETNETLPASCYIGVQEFYIRVVGDVKRAIWLYYLLAGLFSRFLPCVILVISTCLLILELRTGRNILIVNTCQNSLTNKHWKQITRFVVTILIIFLVSELQDAIAFGIYVYEIVSMKYRSVLPPDIDEIWDYVATVLSLISSFSNFWIYLLMSSQFRSSLRSLCPSRDRQGGEATGSTSLHENRSLLKTEKTSASEKC